MSCSYLEGYLHKWTNYYSGWQPRWFILNGGVLSYYLTSSDVQLGSKSSLNVSSCDIIAHSKDNQRIDLVIKGGRRIYLRANSQSERQKWLIALGYVKQQETHVETSSPEGGIIKSRMVELHHSCQSLVTHIASLKSALADKNMLNDTNLDELSTMLSTTCDDFLNILAECMDLSYDGGGQWPEEVKPLSTRQSSFSSSFAPSPLSLSMKQPGTSHKGLNNFFSTPNTLGRIPIPPSNGFKIDELYSSTPGTPTFPNSPLSIKSFVAPDHSLPLHLQKKHTHAPIDTAKVNSTDPSRCQPPSPLKLEEIPRQPSRSNSDIFVTPTSSPTHSPPHSPVLSPRSVSPPSVSPSSVSPPSFPPPPTRRKYETFFTKGPHKFTDICLDKKNGIPSKQFLDCCRGIISFFDILGSTAFAPVKADVNGNIEKIYKKYRTNPEAYKTLQDIVLDELTNQTHAAANSATDALLWLKRGLTFIQGFFYEVSNGEQSIDIAAGTAYGKSLKKYHNFLVRGIFALALRATPYYDDFLKLLGSDGSPEGNQTVISDMLALSKSLENIVSILNQFYSQHQLDI